MSQMKLFTRKLLNSLLVTGVIISSLFLIGCDANSSKGVKDREFETKRITGIWKMRLVIESKGEQKELWAYIVYSKPDKDGKGEQITLTGEKKLAALFPGRIQITATYEDGRVVDFDRYGLDNKVGGSDVFEVTDEEDSAAVLTVDNRKANEIVKKMGGAGDGPEEERTQLFRVVDKDEIRRVELALTEMRSR